MTTALERDIGKHEAQIEALERDVRDLKDEILQQRGEIADMRKEFSAALAEINSTLSEAKGGWRMFMIIGGAGAAIGAGIMKILYFFPGRS